MRVFSSPFLFAEIGSERIVSPEHHLFVRVVSGVDSAAGNREICTGLTSFPSPLCEHWFSVEPLRHGGEDHWEYAYNAHVLVGWTPINTKDKAETMAEKAYRQMSEIADKTGFPYFIRIWHYLPDLNREENGVSRYRAFCKGRRRALSQQVSRGLCAATVIGSQSAGSIIFIATRKPIVAFENPRQVSASDYPMYDDAEKPLFSRAVRWSYPPPYDPHDAIFISGTASIVGSESKHAGDTLAEFREILCNLDNLLHATAHAGGTVDYMKIYMADKTMRPMIKSELAKYHPTTLAVFSSGSICRPELTVEVEAIATHHSA